MTAFVLVHGAWGGAFVFDRLKQDLLALGHTVVVADLRGLGNRASELHGGITLSDHVDDVCEAIDSTGIDRFVLAGHSYGGMVITGVATRLGARIDRLVYIDAFVPADGQSLWDTTSDWEHTHYIDSQKHTPGLVASIFPGMPEPVVRHPLLTFIEALRFTGEEAKVVRRDYIFASAWEPTPFRRFYEMASAAQGWHVYNLPCGHDVMIDQPEQLLAIVLG